MSRSCELTGVKKQIGRLVPVERSQTGVRTLRTFEPNIQRITLLSDVLGKVSLRVAVRTIRSIEHNGGLDKFLLSQRAAQLTTKGNQLKKQVIAKLTEKGQLPKKEAAKRKEPKVSPKRAAAKKAKAAK
jgi:large subunit ribosomal protein L28